LFNRLISVVYISLDLLKFYCMTRSGHDVFSSSVLVAMQFVPYIIASVTFSECLSLLLLDAKLGLQDI